MERTVREYAREDEFVRAAAQFVAREAAAAIRERERFLLVLSGGSTPREIYTALARPPLMYAVDWRVVSFFYGDERCVPPEHEWSNFAMTQETLFHKTQIPMQHVLRMRGEGRAQEEAMAYERTIDDVLGAGGLFDLTLLGMGPDGHTASLFPGSPVLEEAERLVSLVAASDLDPSVNPRVDRLTLTLPALNRSRKAAFLVREQGKEGALSRALSQDPAVPAGRVMPVEELVWFILRK